MKTLRERLLEADDLSGPDAMSAADAAAMRRRVIAHAVAAGVAKPAWRAALAVAAVIALMLTAGVATGHRLPPAAPASPDAPSTLESQPERRQLQFATPGGTRIIWVFDSDFTVKETVP